MAANCLASHSNFAEFTNGACLKNAAASILIPCAHDGLMLLNRQRDDHGAGVHLDHAPCRDGVHHPKGQSKTRESGTVQEIDRRSLSPVKLVTLSKPGDATTLMPPLQLGSYPDGAAISCAFWRQIQRVLSHNISG